jgi:signal transduction histidine kinase
MSTHPHPVRIDTRFILRIYAWAAFSAGVTGVLFGPWLVGPDPVTVPWVRAAAIRQIGALLVVAGCFSLPLANVDDPEARRRGLLWFAIGHAVLAALAWLQHPPIQSAEQAAWVSLDGSILAAVSMLMWVAWLHGEDADGRFGGMVMVSLFGDQDASATRQLRSEYQRRIEAAAAQEERHRLARDLHDSVKQQLFAIHTAAATAQARFEGDLGGVRAAVEQIRASVREAMGEMDAMLQGLRAAPLENVGLVGALQQASEALAFRTGARVDFVPGDLPPSASLPPGAHETAFRVAQEALSNVARHARAAHVTTTIGGRDGALVLTVEDDGPGFDPGASPRGQGLANMRSRAAECRGFLNIENLEAGGTRLELEIPSTTPTPKEARGYGKNALMWGALLVIQAYAVFTESDRNIQRGDLVLLALPVSAMALLFCARDVLAYLRTRRSPEVRR